MNQELVGRIVADLQDQSTQELITSWEQNDRNTYTEEYFEAVKEVLKRRGEVVIPQREFVPSDVIEIRSFRRRALPAVLDAFHGGPQRMPFKDVFFSFKGRVPRSTYWVCGFLIPYAVVMAIGVSLESFTVRLASGPADFVLALVMLIVSLPILVKRRHDRDRSGFSLLAGLVPVLGAIWLLVELGFQTGTLGENRFGKDPLDKLPHGEA